MKNIFFAILMVLIGVNMFSQTETNTIEVKKQHLKSETTRTFTILKQDKDKCIEAFIAAWGEVSAKSVGTFEWKNNKKIPGLDNNIVITIHDGIMNSKKGLYVFFLNEKQKKKKIENLKEYEYRYMTVKICKKTSMGEKNVINSITLENQVVKLLTDILRNIEN